MLTYADVCRRMLTYADVLYIYVSAGASLRLGKTIKKQNAHPRGVDSSTMALVSALSLT
jgi:hypothetical protein